MTYEKKDQRRNPDSERTEEEAPLHEELESKPLEVISLDVDEEGEETRELDAETTLELLEQAQEKAYGQEIAEYTDDVEIQDALEARQELDTGEKKLGEQLEQHHAKSPDRSAGDLDAAWEAANVGEETVGGTAPTPDQDVVDEIGEAVGITYEDDEPLETGDKLAERDRERWELDPRSTDDVEDE